MQLFLLKFFGATPPGTPPKWGPKKSIFLMAQARVLLFFAISRYFTDKYFDIVWGCHPPNGPPKINLNGSTWVPVFYDIRRYLTDNYLDIFWGCHIPPGTPQMDPQKSIFWMAQLRVPVCYDISRDLTDKYLDIVWGCHPPGDPPKINFLNGST